MSCTGVGGRVRSRRGDHKQSRRLATLRAFAWIAGAIQGPRRSRSVSSSAYASPAVSRSGRRHGLGAVVTAARADPQAARRGSRGGPVTAARGDVGTACARGDASRIANRGLSGPVAAGGRLRTDRDPHARPSVTQTRERRAVRAVEAGRLVGLGRDCLGRGCMSEMQRRRTRAERTRRAVALRD